MGLCALYTDSCSEYNFGEVHFVVNSPFMSGLEKQKVYLNFQAQDLQSLTPDRSIRFIKKIIYLAGIRV